MSRSDRWRGSAGAPAIDPAILMALWLWATIDAVGSAREVARLCERDDAYRWLCGGVGINHHTLADFRTAHGAWLDEQLTRSIATLMQWRLITLEVIAQDGLRVRAAAKASSFRRESKLKQLHEQAAQQVCTLKAELEADASASTRRKQAARERATASASSVLPRRWTHCKPSSSKRSREHGTRRQGARPRGTASAIATMNRPHRRCQHPIR